MGTGVAQFGERGQRRPPVGGELGEHVGAEVFGAREDLEPVPVAHDRGVLPMAGECALAAGEPSDSCEESFLSYTSALSLAAVAAASRRSGVVPCSGISASRNSRRTARNGRVTVAAIPALGPA